MNAFRTLEVTATTVLLWAVAAPLGALLIGTADEPEAWRLLFTPDGGPIRAALWNSLWVSALTAAICAGLATAWATVATRRHFPGRGLFSLLPMAPLTLPPLVGVMAFLFLLGDVGLLQGIVTRIAPGTVLPAWNGFGAVLLVHVYSFLPLAYLLLRPAVAGLSRDLDDAAATLGAGRVHRLRHVWWPQLRPALGGAAWLAFMGSMASFSAPYLLGGSTRFLSTEIVARRLGGEMALASVETLLLAGAGLALLLLRPTNLDPPSRAPRPASGARARGWMLVTPALAVVMWSPHVTLLWLSFVEDGTWTWQALPPAYTWSNHTRLLRESSAWESLGHSAWMALPATALGAAWSISVARLEVLGPPRLRSLASLAGAMAWAIPATALALAWLVAYNRPSLAGFGLALTATPWILPWAYTLRFLPLQSRAVVAALAGGGSRLEQVAMTLGASPWRAAIAVTWPAIRGPLLAASALVFVLAVGEFVVSILLYVPENRPVSLEILAHLRLFHQGRAAALGTWLSALLALVLILAPPGGSAWRPLWRSSR